MTVGKANEGGARALYPEVVWLRAIAALAVVAMHALSRVDRASPDIRLAPFIMPLLFATPVFVFISEYLFSRAYPNGLPDGFARKRLTHLVAPYVAMGIAYAVYDGWRGGPGNVVLMALGNIVLGQFVGYFVLVILQFYVLHHFLQQYLKRWRPAVVLSAAFAINALYVGYFNLVREGPGVIEQYIWHRGYWLPAVGWIFYFTLGYYAGQHRDRLLLIVAHRKVWVITALIGAVVMLEGVLSLRVFRFILSSKRPDILIYATVAIAVIMLCAIVWHPPPRFLILISNYSYSIYLLHWFIVNNVPLVSANAWVSALALMGAALIFSIGISWLLNRLPWGIYLVGRPYGHTTSDFGVPINPRP